MQATTGRAELLSQKILDRGLTVLLLECHAPLTGCMPGGDLVQCGDNGAEVRIGQQSPRRQHFGMRDRRLHVVAHQAIVEQMILAGREGKHPVVERRALVP